MNENGTKIKKAIVDIFETLVIALAISIVIYLTIAIPNQVDGVSMEPNFKHNEFLLTNKTIQWLGQTSFGQNFNYDYKRGDVIIFHNGESDLIKRIIAVGGDTIRIEDDSIFVNDKKIDEKYIPITIRTEASDSSNAFLVEGETITVPEGSYFVMGDNRENSKDSRLADVGFVDRENIRGKVFFRYWPLNKFGIIKRGEFTEIEIQTT